jgi:hypothetical protein
MSVNNIASKQICVVLDANVWVSNLMLKRGLGASLLHSLNRAGGCLGLPEIVEREVVKNMVRLGLKANEGIKKHFEMLGTLTGSKFRYPSLPSEENLTTSIVKRMAIIDKLLSRLPFTLEHAKAALDRVMLGLPPNGPKNQQFKDSAIWEAILEMCPTHKTYFVTKDLNFFKSQKPDMGLAENLLNDCVGVGGEVLAYDDLAGCLSAITEHVPPYDYGRIALRIDEVINHNLVEQAAGRAFELGELTGKEISPFPTEDPDLIGVKFKLGYRIFDVSQPRIEERNDASLNVVGDCTYDITRGEASDISFDEQVFVWQDSSGEIHKSRNLFIRVHDSVIVSDSFGS